MDKSKLNENEKEIMEALEKSITEKVDEFKKGQISEITIKGFISAAIDEAKKNNPEFEIKDVKGLQKQLDDFGISLKAMEESGKQKTSEKEFGQILQENIKSIESGIASPSGRGTLTIPLKSLGIDLATKTTVLPNSFTSDTAGIYLPGFGQKTFQRIRMASLFSQFPIGADSHGIIYYTDQTTTTRNAASRSVGSAAAESALAWTVYNKTLESISDSIPIAKEMLGRYSQMEAEVRNFITNNLLIKEDNLLVTGTGTTPQIKGIYTYATAFNSGAYTGFKADGANLFDLIVIMATEIMKSSSYVVDTVILNPADARRILLAKDDNKQYIIPPFAVKNGIGEWQILNIRVVESASQTANTLTIGDFTRARRYYGDNLTLEFGYNTSGDFAKRIVTLLGNMEELLLVRNCEADAFLKSTDIAADITNVTS